MTDPLRPSTSRISRALGAVAEPAVSRLLIVDDEETIRVALAKFLRGRGFEVTTAESGTVALEYLRGGRFVAMLSDVRMPGMPGTDLVPQALAIDPDLAVIMLTAVNDAPTATEALAAGAMDYLMKPVELADLTAALERALHKRDLLIEQRKVERLIREEVALRTDELEREQQALRQLTISVVDALINAQEAKDQFLRGHSQRVADLAASVAEHLGLDPDTVEHVRLAGRLHDVGKIGTRESVLNKPGPLTEEEYEHVKEHVRLGVEILSPLKHLGPALTYIHDHHEHWNGKGYPRRLAGEAISIGGRILAAADAFDALTTRRPYREPMNPDDTIEYLQAHVGTLMDPRVYEALRAIVTRRRSLVFLDDLSLP
ncbi:MAG: HD domain-containing phosphohydrolase [Gemmatimonadota bacterium]|jgi:putative nucleotidyltransferase with HDIG domain|nr:response regulator [Gemmatimonadota bacterium]